MLLPRLYDPAKLALLTIWDPGVTVETHERPRNLPLPVLHDPEPFDLFDEELVAAWRRGREDGYRGRDRSASETPPAREDYLLGLAYGRELRPINSRRDPHARTAIESVRSDV